MSVTEVDIEDDGDPEDSETFVVKANVVLDPDTTEIRINDDDSEL